MTTTVKSFKKNSKRETKVALVSHRGDIWVIAAAVSCVTSNLFGQTGMVYVDPFTDVIAKALIAPGLIVLKLRSCAHFRNESQRYWIKGILLYASVGIVSEMIGMIAYFQAVKLGWIDILKVVFFDDVQMEVALNRSTYRVIVQIDNNIKEAN